MDAAHIPAPQLGRILIAAGLLNEEQLERALEEQARTGRRLGEIIVQSGFVSGPALANALAEQHGGVLKTEYGFASGLGGIVARRAASESGTAVSPLRPPDAPAIPQLRTAEPQPEAQVPRKEQEDGAPPGPPEHAEPTPLQEAPLQADAPPEPQAPSAEQAPESTQSHPQQPSVLPPLLRAAEPLAPPPSPSVPELELERSPAPEPEPTLPAETDDSGSEPVELHPSDEPLHESLPRLEPEREEPTPNQPDPPAEAAEVLPEPVEIRPALSELVHEAPAADEPELPLPPAPTPPGEAAEPLPEPVELRPPVAEPVHEPPRSPELTAAPEPEPAAPAEVAEPERVEFPPPLATPLQEAPREPEPKPDPELVQPEPEPAAAARDDRDELIESLRARVEAQEQELVKLREQLEQERARTEVQVHVWPEEQPTAAISGPAQKEPYLLCVPTTAGYVLLDRVGALPSIGQPVDVPEEEGQFTVTKVVRLPRNGRPCAYLQRA